MCVNVKWYKQKLVKIGINTCEKLSGNNTEALTPNLEALSLKLINTYF